MKHISQVITKISYKFMSQKDLDHALIEASGSNNIDEISSLVKHGANINAKRGEPLATAVCHGHIEAVKLLLELGAKVHIGRDRVFVKAMLHNREEILEILRASSTDPRLESVIKAYYNKDYNQVLLYAIEFMHSKKLVEYLIKKGADVNYNSGQPIMLAVEARESQIVDILCTAGADISFDDHEALIRAAHSGSENTVRVLLKHHADVNAKKDQALMKACSNRFIDLVKLLLKKGANINARDGEAMEHACQTHDVDLVQYLLQNGFELDSAGGRQAFQWCCANKKLKMLDLFPSHDKNFLISDSYKQLRVAIQYGDLNVVKRLISYIEKPLFDYFVHCAVVFQKHSILEYFLKNVEKPTNILYDPLLIAVRNRDLKSAKMLKSKGLWLEYSHFEHAAEIGDVTLFCHLLPNNDANWDLKKSLQVAITNRHGHVTIYSETFEKIKMGETFENDKKACNFIDSYKTFQDEFFGVNASLSVVRNYFHTHRYDSNGEQGKVVEAARELARFKPLCKHFLSKNKMVLLKYTSYTSGLSDDNCVTAITIAMNTKSIDMGRFSQEAKDWFLFSRYFPIRQSERQI